MFYRWAKKELMDGRARREAAAAAEKAEIAAEKAKIAAGEKAEKDKAAKAAKHARDLENFRRDGLESEERWARLDEETRVANAAWAAGKEERERAAAQQAAVSPVNLVVRRADVHHVRPQPARQAAQQAPASPVPAAPVPQVPANPSNWPFDKVQKAVPPAATRQPTPGPTRTAAPAASRSGPGQRPAPTLVPTRTGASPSARHPTPMQRPSPAPTTHRSTPTRPTSPPITQTVPPSSRQPVFTPHPAPQVRPPTSPPVIQRATAPVPPPASTLNGADLARWRASAGLTQRAAAERLGVAPSTVAKAELLPEKALGEQLRVALGGLLLR